MPIAEGHDATTDALAPTTEETPANANAEKTTTTTTADTDDRGGPGHSFKFAAQLQHCHTGQTPVLIRIETRAGHGAGKPTAKIIEEVADKWAFLIQNLKMTPRKVK